MRSFKLQPGKFNVLLLFLKGEKAQLIKMSKLETILPEEDKEAFPPIGDTLTFIRGRKLSQMGDWIKAVILVEDFSGREQIRLYGWQRRKDGSYSTRQKFNISAGWVGHLIRVLEAFEAEKGYKKSEKKPKKVVRRNK